MKRPFFSRFKINVLVCTINKFFIHTRTSYTYVCERQNQKEIKKNSQQEEEMILM